MRKNFPNGPPARNHSPRTVSRARTISPTPMTSADRVDRCPATFVRAALTGRPRPSVRRPARTGRRPRGFRFAFERERAITPLPVAYLRLRRTGRLHLHDHRHDHRLTLRGLEEVFTQAAADVLFQQPGIGNFFLGGLL